MKNYFVYRLIFCVFCIMIFCAGCKKNEPADTIVFSEKYTVEFCGKENAGEIISTDTTEHFFDYVTEADMDLQMKIFFSPEIFLHAESNFQKIFFYKNFLKNLPENFSEKEKNILKNIFSELFSLCEKCGVKTLPEKINLIKTKIAPYGENTFFTRNDAIIIPEKSLMLDRTFLLQTMLHELCHILLRYNPALKQKLFSLIGFEKKFSDKLVYFSDRKELITNPDAVGYQYFWRVSKQLNTPNTLLNFYLYCDTAVIRSKKTVEYFEVLKTGATDENFQEVKNFDLRPVNTYFGTDYLLQPDEIIAVYFSTYIYGTKNPEILNEASPFVVQIGKTFCTF